MWKPSPPWKIRYWDAVTGINGYPMAIRYEKEDGTWLRLFATRDAFHSFCKEIVTADEMDDYLLKQEGIIYAYRLGPTAYRQRAKGT